MSTVPHTDRRQPKWHKPTPAKQPVLWLKNSLANDLVQKAAQEDHSKKELEFIPKQGRHVTWYNCGPTVYDASHLGHARTYLTMDIIRRVLEDYFHYEVLFVQNVTDIDDKIILRARQQYLFNTLKTQTTTVDQALIQQVEQDWSEYAGAMLKSIDADTTAIQDWSAFVTSMTPDKVTEAVAKDEKFKMKFSAAKASFDALQKVKATGADTSKAAADALLDASQDIVSIALDKKKGAEVNDPKIFRDLPAYWEDRFYEDMAALNVRPPDVQTRVSEYVPEIIDYVQKIIDNGYAYAAEGSVYFDTGRFDGHDDHFYAKLMPTSKGDTAMIEDGEGSLGSKLEGKKLPSDFALWKASKPGEPAWKSHWGMGRPGWHIECSVMADAILDPDNEGVGMDIHSGGIDLKFPHHDNEIAQSEACHHKKCSQWVNYFLHAGHLHIEGQKMSKSLKNFMTIQEALQKYTARQIRLLFLSESWDGKLDFSENKMLAVSLTEATFKNFFDNVKAHAYKISTDGSRGATPCPDGGITHRYGKAETEFLKSLQESQKGVHEALCASIDTNKALESMKDLVKASNVYMQRGTDMINVHLLNKAARWITSMLKIFGVVENGVDIGFGSTSQAENAEEKLMPYLHALSSFRDETRKLAKGSSNGKALLDACDDLRDNKLVDLGVCLDDQADGTALVKLVPRDELIKAREEKRAAEADKAAKKIQAAAERERKERERLEKAKVRPEDLFQQKNEYAGFTFDPQGIPTHTSEGKEVTNNQRKKLQKEWDNQKKQHEKYLASLPSS